jgi:uncharacterized paraquat-inducible protein A
MHTVICPDCRTSHEIPDSAQSEPQTCSQCGCTFVLRNKPPEMPGCTGTRIGIVVLVLFCVTNFGHSVRIEQTNYVPGLIAAVSFTGIFLLHGLCCLRRRLWRIEITLMQHGGN